MSQEEIALYVSMLSLVVSGIALGAAIVNFINRR